MALATIVPYDPAWPEEFRRAAAELRRALGPHALRIDHIGSTAVPGLPAKDVIDIQVVLAALDPAIVDALRRAGFQLRPFDRDHRPPGADGPAEDWAKRLMVEPPGGRRLNVHVRVEGKPNQRYACSFATTCGRTPMRPRPTARSSARWPGWSWRPASTPTSRTRSAT